MQADIRRRQSGQWPLIRPLLALFSLPHCHWYGRAHVRSLLQFLKADVELTPAMLPLAPVRAHWDGVKHGAAVFLHLCSAEGRDLAAGNNAAVRAAARFGFAHAAAFLLALPPERRVDPSANNNEALRRAAEYGHADVVRLLLSLPVERDVDPAADDNNALDPLKRLPERDRAEIERRLHERRDA